MKRSLLGVALLSASWLLGLNHYHQPSWLAWLVVVAAGTALLAGAVRRLPSRAVSVFSVLLLAPAVALAPWPYRMALLLPAAGLLLAALPAPTDWPRRLGAPLAVAGAILVAQALTMLAYQSCTARWADAPPLLAWVLGGLLRLAGIDAAVDGSHVVLFSMRLAHRIPVTWALLADPVSMCFLAGVMVLVWLRALGTPARLRRGAALAAGLAACVAAWLPIRAVLLLAVYMHRALRTAYDDPLDLMNQFWSPWMHLALLAGPVLLAWGLLRAKRASPEHGAAALPAPVTPAPLSRAGPSAWQPALAAVVAAAAAAVLAAAVAWDPIGQRKGGRVLVDDYHSLQPWSRKDFDTTRTDRPFDTKWYGHESSYHYGCIYDYCSRFYRMSRQTQPLDRDALRDCDVLVLKVPSLAYSPAEIEAVREFVDRGGGLLMLGEHTAVYGSGANLNELAREFGFRYRYDCAFGIDSFFEQHYVPPVVPHPILQHVGELDFATSCTIDPFGAGRAAIQDAGLKSLEADYHAPNFYPQAEDLPEMRYGAFVQLWATRRGAGRVVAFTDSTIFACFLGFEPGKSELMLGMLEWLNHRNHTFDPRLLLTLLGAVLAGAAISLGRPGRRYWPLLLAAGACGWAICSTVLADYQRSAMPPPRCRRPMVRVVLDRTASQAELPRNGFIAGKEGAFGLFERSILRLGYFTQRAGGPLTPPLTRHAVSRAPSRGVKGGPDVTQGDVVVVLHPSRSVSREFRDRLAAYVRAGGKLLVLDSPENAGSTANSLLWPFGMSVKRATDPVLHGRLEGPPRWPAPMIESACEVAGGQPLATLSGRPVAALARCGKGAVWVLGFGSRFADAHMGVTGDVVPRGDLVNVYELEYALFRAVVADAPPATGPAVGPATAPETAPAPESREAPP